MASEYCGTQFTQLAVGGADAGTGLLGAGVILGSLTLLGHQPTELTLIDGQALLGRDLDREIDREAVSVVESEGVVATQRRPVLVPRLPHGDVEDGRASGEGTQEGVLLAVGDHRDPVNDRACLVYLVQAIHPLEQGGHSLKPHPGIDIVVRQGADDLVVRLSRTGTPDAGHEDQERYVWDVIRCASTKPFGFQEFRPGPGVGGHCIPVDPFDLAQEINSAR
jgi:hypothetical protein